jgi:hypothetical protein
MEGYCVALPKPTRIPIPSLRYYLIKRQGSTSFLKKYWSCPKLLNTLVIHLVGYPRNTLGSITYFFETWKSIA